jgi:hypothetical protein
MENKRTRADADRLTPFYLASIYSVTLMLVALLLGYLRAFNAGPVLVITMAACLVVLVSHPIIAAANSVLRLVLRPRPLPAIEFPDGVDQENTTLVVIPDLLMNSGKIDALVNQLRGHFLRNIENNVYFGLLTDWVDCSNEHDPGDRERLDQVLTRIRDLNSEYGAGGRRPFFLLHRNRRWNEYDQTWMGYERKRGKLHDLINLVLSGDLSAFAVLEGDLAAITRAKNIITLDSDTILPNGAAIKLISTIAHPANAARFSEDGVIVSGYAILQPRMLATAPTGVSSWYERFRVRQRGTDPRTSSFDVFQDFFGEGCFTGVGIISVADFHRAFGGMVPENHLLSHDIIEGCFARSGRAASVSMFENMPPTFHAASRRHHRWTRGDWQNSSWLFPSIPSASGRRKNTLSLLSRWKIFKGMNASLFSLSIMSLLFVSAVTHRVPEGIVVALGAVFLPVVVDILVSRLSGAWPRPRTVVDLCTHALMMVTLAPFEGLTNLDAIVRAVYRLGSKRRALEWVPSSAYEGDNIGALGYVRYMWKSPAVATALVAWMWLWSANWNVLVAAVVSAWALAPLFAWYISRRVEGAAPVPSDAGRESREATA